MKSFAGRVVEPLLTFTMLFLVALGIGRQNTIFVMVCLFVLVVIGATTRGSQSDERYSRRKNGST